MTGGRLGHEGRTLMVESIYQALYLIRSEVSQRRRNVIRHPFYVGSKNETIQMNLLTKQKETHRLRKRSYGCWGGGDGCVVGRRGN